MPRSLPSLSLPELKPTNWPCPGARSFIMPDDQFAPVVFRGDTVSVVPARRIRAGGSHYIMASGPSECPRYAIVHVKRVTAGHVEALTFGPTEDGGFDIGTPHRLSRAKWRPFYRCVAYSYTRNDPPIAKDEMHNTGGGNDAA